MKANISLPLGLIFLSAAATLNAQDKPNVIFLVADDLGFGDLSCFGGTEPTPNADALAASGLRFTNAHASAATSTPSRYSILTGQYPWRKPGTNVLPGNAGLIIAPEQYTVARMFQDAGYATAAIGKWHLGLGSETARQDWNGTLDHTPRHIGFDYHYIQAATADRVPCVYIEQDTIANRDPQSPIEVSYAANFPGEPTGRTNRSALKLDWTHGHDQTIVDSISRIGYSRGGGRALWRDENIADSIAEHSRRFIMQHRNEPFFMWLCTNDVHVPRWPHERFRGKSSMGLRGDAISSFDWTVGRILEALDSAGVRENTLIVLTSDNGPVMDDGYDDHAYERLGDHQPTGGSRGDKYSNYEGGTRVPLIISWPAQVQPESEARETLLSLIDLFGSAAALINARLPEGAAPDSRNMLDQLLGRSNVDRPWVAELGQAMTVGVRTPHWKFIPAGPKEAHTLSWPATGHNGAVIELGESTGPQLYNMVSDPGETTNLAPAMPAPVLQKFNRLHQLITNSEF